MCGAGPGDLGESRGADQAENPGKTGPNISGQTAFKYPGCPPGSSNLGVGFGATLGPARPGRKHTPGAQPPLSGCHRGREIANGQWSAPKNWVPEDSLAGDFRPGLPGISAKSDPRDPPRSPGPAPHINSHRGPSLRPFRGTQKILPDCLQIPKRITSEPGLQAAHGYLPAITPSV